MTNREFFELVVTGSTVTAEMEAHALKSLEALDRKNAQRRNSESKAEKENKPLRKELFGLMNKKPTEIYTASEIAGMMEGISTQKATALLKGLVNMGLVEQDEVKIKGKGKQKSYKIVAGATFPEE